MSLVTPDRSAVAPNCFIHPVLSFKYWKEAAVVAGLAGSIYLYYSRSTHLNRRVADWKESLKELTDKESGLIAVVEHYLTCEDSTIMDVKDFAGEDLERYPRLETFLEGQLEQHPVYAALTPELEKRKTMVLLALDSLIIHCRTTKTVGEVQQSIVAKITIQLIGLRRDVAETTAAQVDTRFHNNEYKQYPFTGLTGFRSMLRKIAEGGVTSTDVDSSHSYIGDLADKLSGSSDRKASAINTLYLWAWAARGVVPAEEGNDDSKSVLQLLEEGDAVYTNSVSERVPIDEATKNSLRFVKGQLEAFSQKPSFGTKDFAWCLTPVALAAGFCLLSRFQRWQLWDH